jgi:hypothetical protein
MPFLTLLLARLKKMSMTAHATVGQRAGNGAGLLKSIEKQSQKSDAYILRGNIISLNWALCLDWLKATLAVLSEVNHGNIYRSR